MNRRRWDDHLPSRRIPRWLAANWPQVVVWACLAALFGLAAFGLHDALARVA